MDIEYLGMLWQKDEDNKRFSVTSDELHALIRAEGARFEKRLQSRDWLELSLAVFLGVFFIVAALFFERDADDSILSQWDWLLLGLGFFVVAGLFTRMRLDARAHQPEPEDTILQTLKKSRNSVAKQVHFLNNTWWMYVLPIALPLAFVAVRSFPEGKRVDYAVVCGIVFVGIIAFNRWYAARRLQPKLDELEMLIEAMQS